MGEDMTDLDSGSGQGEAAGDDRGEIVFYQAAEGKPALEVRLERNALWLTQQQMTDLFDTERSVITKHLRNIFRSEESAEESNVQKMHIAGSDKRVAFYHLDAIISAALPGPAVSSGGRLTVAAHDERVAAPADVLADMRVRKVAP